MRGCGMKMRQHEQKCRGAPRQAASDTCDLAFSILLLLITVLSATLLGLYDIK